MSNNNWILSTTACGVPINIILLPLIMGTWAKVMSSFICTDFWMNITFIHFWIVEKKYYIPLVSNFCKSGGILVNSYKYSFNSNTVEDGESDISYL